MELTFGQAILAYFVSPLLTLLTIVVFVNVIMSWLVAFNVVNAHNQFVRMVWQTTEAIVAPLLAPIRRLDVVERLGVLPIELEDLAPGLDRLADRVVAVVVESLGEEARDFLCPVHSGSVHQPLTP